MKGGLFIKTMKERWRIGIFDGFEVHFQQETSQKVEKKSFLSGEYRAGAVRERVPLKQGLKPCSQCHTEVDERG